MVLTASNLYLGLKIGLTVASSIPAAVISMGVLRLCGGASVGENNLVQTQASAAGTLSCVFASLPSLIMVGAWHGFPFWQTAGVTMAGGVAGVLFTVPLRRALVTESRLPYPEGVAAAAILHAGATEGRRGHLSSLVAGGAVSAAVTLLSGGFRLLADTVGITGMVGGGVLRLQAGFSLALLGAGYLIGIRAGLAIAGGVALAWGIGVPVLSALDPNPARLGAVALGTSVWMHQVRFVGAGTIAVAALWTLAGLAAPVGRGLRDAVRRRDHGLRPETDRDLSPRMILGLLAVSMALLLWLFVAFLLASGASETQAILAAALTAVLFFVLFGFMMAAACGVMAGIVGSSASPISGIAILATILIAVLMLGLRGLGLLPHGASAAGPRGAVAFCLFVTTAIIAAAAISNDNLQDLKTGQLVGATPWRQQAVLLVGCVGGALVVPPVLQLLYDAYGFVGAMPRPGMDETRALAAPQPALLAAIASGIFARSLDWTMISIGLLLGIMLVGADWRLRRGRQAGEAGLPVLAVGLGIYMPTTITVMLSAGAVLNWTITRRMSREQHGAQIGTMIASGFIVGESLMGLCLAGVAIGTGRENALSLLPTWFGEIPLMSSMAVFAGAITWFARTVHRADRSGAH